MPQAIRVAVGRAAFSVVECGAEAPPPRLSRELSSHRPQVATPAFRRRGRPAGRHHDAAQCAGQRTAGARVRLCRRPRRRQDDDGPHPCARAQLRPRPHARPVRPVRRVHRDRAGPRPGRAGDRRRQQHRHRQRARGHHQQSGDSARTRSLQDLRHRRGPPALEPLLQRPAQVGGGAASARRVHHGDDRAAQDPRHHPVARAGLRVPNHRRHRDCGPVAPHRRRRVHRDRRRRADDPGALCRRQHARRAKRLRPGAVVCRRHRDRRRRRVGPRAGGPRPAVRHPQGSRRRRRVCRLRAGRQGRRGRLRPSHPLPGTGGPGARDDAGLDRPAAAVGSRRGV